MGGSIAGPLGGRPSWETLSSDKWIVQTGMLLSFPMLADMIPFQSDLQSMWDLVLSPQLPLPYPASPGDTHPSAFLLAHSLCPHSGLLATFLPLDGKILTDFPEEKRSDIEIGEKTVVYTKLVCLYGIFQNLSLVHLIVTVMIPVMALMHIDFPHARPCDMCCTQCLISFLQKTGAQIGWVTCWK